MVEVPSLILAIKIFDKEVDFYSVGTNDLTQYLFAVDRTSRYIEDKPPLSILISTLQQSISSIQQQRPVSICGADSSVLHRRLIADTHKYTVMIDSSVSATVNTKYKE